MSATAALDYQAAVLVSLDFGDPGYQEGVEELVRLVESAGVARHAAVRGRRARPDPKFYVGSGKVADCRVIEVLADYTHDHCIADGHGEPEAAT